jgi:flagellar biogenesis protein FliO
MMPSGVELRALASLAVVIGALALFVWAMRKGVLRVGRFAPRQGIVVETAVAMGDRRSLVIVSVEGRRLLLGSTPGSLSLIADLAPVPVERQAS